MNDNRERVSIRDHHPNLFQNFEFSLNEQVRIKDDGRLATVDDAIWEGGNGPVSVTYHVVTESGEKLQLDVECLESI